MSECFCYVSAFEKSEEADDKISYRGHDPRSALCSYLGAIFIKGHIANPMKAVLDCPVSPIQFEQACWVGFVWWQACDPIDCFLGFLVTLNLGNLSADAYNLFNVGKLQVIVQFRTDPDLPNFQTTVFFIDGLVLRGENQALRVLRCPFLKLIDCF